MPQQEEFTPNLKTEAKDPNIWEESLPKPLEGEITQARIEATEKVQESPNVSQVVGLRPRRKFPVKKLLLVLLSLLTLGVVTFLIFNFSQSFDKLKKFVPSKQSSPTPLPKDFSFKRISSAFVPKIPTAGPASLSENWQKIEDDRENFVFFYPEEWQVVKNNNNKLYILYYPVIDENQANFGDKVLAKLSIEQTLPPVDDNLAEFLLRRYNLSENQITEIATNLKSQYSFKWDNFFVFGEISATKLYILEGRVAKLDDFEIFLPIFNTISATFQVL